MKLEYLLGQLASLDKLWFPWQQKAPIDLKCGKQCLHLFSVVFLSDFFSKLQVTRTGIKSRTSSNFGQIVPLPTGFGALEHLKNFP